MVNIQRIIVVALLALPLLSCQEIPLTIGEGRGDRVVVSVGESRLMSSEVISALPPNTTGEDSVEFARLYSQRWIKRQIKAMEAERIFSSSAQEIEELVSSYRNSLLTRKLDQYYINTSREEPFTQEDIERYYNEHNDRFKLDKRIVKGRLLRIPQGYDGESKLLSLMKSSSDDSRLDLISISEKFSDLRLQEYTTTWIDFSEFISMLPVVRENSDSYLKRSGIQSLEDATHTYLFEITEYRNIGDIAPFERVEGLIRNVLTSTHHAELIRSRDEQLYRRAMESDIVRSYVVGVMEQSDYPAMK